MSLFYIFHPQLRREGGGGATATGISFNHDIPIQEFRLGGTGAIQARDERCGGISVPVVWVCRTVQVAEVVSIQPLQSGAFARRGEARRGERARGNGDPGFTRLRACSFFPTPPPPYPVRQKKQKKGKNATQFKVCAHQKRWFRSTKQTATHPHARSGRCEMWEMWEMCEVCEVCEVCECV